MVIKTLGFQVEVEADDNEKNQAENRKNPEQFLFPFIAEIKNDSSQAVKAVVNKKKKQSNIRRCIIMKSSPEFNGFLAEMLVDPETCKEFKCY